MQRDALSGRVRVVSAGKRATLVRAGRVTRSAFVKDEIEGRVHVGVLGLAADEHVYRDHGGPDMALLAYPFEHYAHWRALRIELPENGALGENLTVVGLREADVHIGDVFAVGTAVVQVSQPRAPCSKIAARFGRTDMPAMARATGYTGYLLRVLAEGEIGAGDDMRLVDRHSHGVSVADAGRVLNVDRSDIVAARRVLGVNTLGSSVRRQLAERVAAADVEAQRTHDA